MRSSSASRAETALSIVVEGPMDSSSSLAIVNRGFIDALSRVPGVVARAGLPDVHTTHVIRNMYPPRLDAGAEDVRTLFYFAWEDSRIPTAWAQAFNRHFDGLLVPSTHVRDVVERSGVTIPVAVVPYGLDTAAAPAADRVPSSPLTHKTFRFLHVSTGFPRKGCDVLLRAFAREFSSSEDVALIVKTLPQYDHPTVRLIRRTRWGRLRCPEIVHIDRDLDVSVMHDLYASASCLVHPARAEGFGLPIAEAMLARVPVIVSAHSGHSDFCTPDTAAIVPSRPVRSRSPFVVPDAEWGEPDEPALRRAMRHVFEHRDDPAVATRVARAEAHVRTFTWNRAAARAVEFLRRIEVATQPTLRVGMLTTWHECCGIAEYSRQLIAAVDDASIAWTVLAPEPEGVRTDAMDSQDTSLPAIRCWRHHWPVDVSGAVEHIRRLNLDVVHVQSHLNMWSAASMETLARIAADGRRVFMTLHSVRGARPDVEVVRLLSRIDRVFVHTDDDRVRLLRMGVDRNVTVLPQGYPASVDEPVDAVRARLGIDAADRVIGTFGFLRPHKGVVELIRAVGHMRSRHPRLTLLALTALYPSADSTQYHEQCLVEAERQGLAGRCLFVTDFLDPQACMAALQACDAVVLPYHPAIDSSSAAVRAALASRRPVVTSTAPVFAEVADAVLSVGSVNRRTLARAIARVLDDGDLRTRLAAAAARRLDEESWSVVGRTYRKFLRSAAMDMSDLREPYSIVTPS